ncbi:hypothetical protein CBER1_05253 [Cercospora berteroae]|uniref:Large ribosomal subunit protein mL67 n=1 Tax=Cercospora berteroae TaxID=357750 RepID=A0A2S6BT69_9PEZI|nr:hypothetical protein CBER1_05253 [Cercospora berteroae]
MQRSMRATHVLPKGHGEAIYAYCNIRTNQVLYSLERTLRQSHLEQLADVGANNNPPKIRKDIWRPLFTVHLPDRQQGLELFRSLREYRLLHETNWELPESIKTPYTEKQIEEMQAKLDNRGGSKKETVFDVIKREKKKLRVKMVMNQKANSVADLAAILVRQEEQSASLASQKEALLKQRKAKVLGEIISLAKEFERSGNKDLDKQIAELRAEVKEATKKSLDKSNTAKVRKEQYQKAQTTREALQKIRVQAEKRLWASESVKKAKERAATESSLREQAAKTNEAAAEGARESNPKEPSPSKPILVEYRQFIEPYPPELDPIRAALEGKAFSKRDPLYRAHKRDVRLVQRPIYGTKGIAVQWANSLDLEYAEMWPKNVNHLSMGFVRNAAPKADAKAVHEISDFKAQQWKSRPANWDAVLRAGETGALEAAEPIAEGGSIVEAQAAEQKQEEDRQAVLQEVKERILHDLKVKAITPAHRWPKALAKSRRQRRDANRQDKQTTSQTSTTEKEVVLPAEPTSSENAPTL